MKHINLNNRLFLVLGTIAVIFAAGFFVGELIAIGQGLLILAGALTLADLVFLFMIRRPFRVKRVTDKILSLSDPNRIVILIENLTGRTLKLMVIDELPYQLQVRDLQLHTTIRGREKKRLIYHISPPRRGEYGFGRVVVFMASPLGLLRRRIFFPLGAMIPVYPSLIQVKKYALHTLPKLSQYYGVKKMRKIGHSYEFETIKSYVPGDDRRTVNWKATSRRNHLMVNVYEDEKSQNVYAVIDKSRSMMLPFNGLTLMDYAINASLVIASSALQKHDKAGLITFSDVMGSMIRADDVRLQLNRIAGALYQEQERNTEADFGLLYQGIEKLVRGRSLIFLYTSFGSIYSAERVIPMLRRINRKHLLVTVLFKNTELEQYSQEPAGNLEEIYQKTIARRNSMEAEQISAMLGRHGIETITTRPEDLTISSINKYLELKARGRI
ncbi:MAG: DUF58 domain-containing protein [Bacteroidales bacterium]